VLWLAPLSPSGVHRLLARLGVVYRRGQEHLHSPDPDYAAKRAAVRRARAEARLSGGKAVLVYLDEFTYYRRPSAARCYAPAGGPGPPAEQGHGRNRKRRVVGALDALTGRLTCWQGGKAGVAELVAFYRRLAQAYPEAAVIYVAQDNWPVHFLPGVTEAVAGTPIRLLRLPTYAPWTNPVEKVWRKLRQEVLHQHDFADDWAGLQAEVAGWLARAAPADLLRYTGLRRRKRKPKHR
jgi:transposase